MGKIYYISGGARSGKSNFAEKIALESQKKKIYIATAKIYDEEMQNRINLHKNQRGDNWITLEAYKNLANLLLEYKEENAIILLDCLTNLVTNYMFDFTEDWDSISTDKITEIQNTINKDVENLLDFITSSKLDLIVVSNELGMGLVPTYPLGRHFRDISGKLNQIVAAKADKASFIVSGLELSLK